MDLNDLLNNFIPILEGMKKNNPDGFHLVRLLVDKIDDDGQLKDCKNWEGKQWI